MSVFVLLMRSVSNIIFTRPFIKRLVGDAIVVIMLFYFFHNCECLDQFVCISINFIRL